MNILNKKFGKIIYLNESKQIGIIESKKTKYYFEYSVVAQGKPKINSKVLFETWKENMGHNVICNWGMLDLIQNTIPDILDTQYFYSPFRKNFPEEVFFLIPEFKN